MWSPDGKKIAFISDRSDGNQIFVMKADGSEVSQLTDSQINKQDPTWSPDGKKIAYVAFQEKTGYDIFIMTIDNSETEQLTDNSNFNLSPTWSPDGRVIAYESWDMSMIKKETPFLIFTATQSKEIFIIYQKDDRGIEDIKSSICVIGANGIGQKKLTKDDSSNWSPSWAPTSQQIVFSSDRETDTKIYMMNVDGSQVLSITIDSGNYFTPRW
jgi:TolB protein